MKNPFKRNKLEIVLDQQKIKAAQEATPREKYYAFLQLRSEDNFGLYQAVLMENLSQVIGALMATDKDQEKNRGIIQGIMFAHDLPDHFIKGYDANRGEGEGIDVDIDDEL